MEDKGEFYIGIRNPDEFRRDLLESTKGLVQTLRRYEEFKELRVQKIEYIAQLKIILKEIQILVGRMKQQLPKVKLRALNKFKIPEKLEEAKAQSDLDKLENELSFIESKIKGLN